MFVGRKVPVSNRHGPERVGETLGTFGPEPGPAIAGTAQWFTRPAVREANRDGSPLTLSGSFTEQALN